MKHLAVNIVDEFFSAGGKEYTQLSDIGVVATLLVKITFAVLGVVILIFIIMAGIGIISGAGSNDPEKIEKGKQTATSALIGFVVVFVAYWIVQLVELWTGIKIL